MYIVSVKSHGDDKIKRFDDGKFVKGKEKFERENGKLDFVALHKCK